MNVVAENNNISLDDLQNLLPTITRHLSKEDRDDIREVATVIVGTDDVDEEELVAAVKAFFEIIVGQAPKLVAYPNNTAPSPLQKWKDFIGKRISDERNARGITQKQLAEMTGLTQSHISRIERAKLAPSHLTVCKIAVALDIPASKLDPSA